jgi:outer membrane immunogenic protein
MRTKTWCGIGVLASIVASVGAAGAADLAVKAPVYKAPPPVYLSDWSGFYLGVNGGGAWANATYDDSFFDVKPSGGLFGGHAGYNWQYGSVVTGLEVDFDGADIKGSVPFVFVPFPGIRLPATEDTKFDELATARARLGYLVLPNLLAYGTAGVAWGHVEVTDTVSILGSQSSAANLFGWTAGAGLEYKLLDHVLVRGEYLHYGFGQTGISNFDGNNIKANVDAVRGGVSYKF